MQGIKSGMIHALEFSCQAPLKFYERCAACPRFGDDCLDLQLGKDILRGRKKVAYGEDGSEDGIHAGSFKCLAPLYYFEKSRSKCPHGGRCREEGLLLALLSGKKQLSYAQKAVIELPLGKARSKEAVTREAFKTKSMEQKA
jgi:hypothetical protein